VLPHLILVLSLGPQAGPVDILTRQAQEAFQLGKYSEARDKLREALKQSPRSPALWSYLGLAEAELKDLDAAISDFQKALRFAPSDAQTHFNLGLLYRRKGDPQKALETYQRGLKLNPDDPAANQNFSLLLMEMGRFRKPPMPLLPTSSNWPKSSSKISSRRRHGWCLNM
jgi:tetratricopeptide (TPR) repeat protein